MKKQEFTPLKGPKHHIRVPPFSPVGYHLARGIHIGENPARKFIPALNLPGWRCPTKRHKTGLKLRTQKGITFTQHGSWGGAGVLVFRERDISPVLVTHISFTKKWTSCSIANPNIIQQEWNIVPNDLKLHLRSVNLPLPGDLEVLPRGDRLPSLGHRLNGTVWSFKHLSWHHMMIIRPFQLQSLS